MRSRASRRPVSCLLRFAAMLVSALAVHASAAVASGQQAWSAIEGSIHDEAGEVLPDAAIAVTSSAGFRVPAARSEADGHFRIGGLLGGEFRLTVSYPGFSPVTRDHVLVAAGQVLRLDFALPVAPLETQLEVSAAPPLVDVNSHASATVIRKDVIARVPKGRDFTSLVAAVTPGVNAESKAAGLQVDGASGAENRFFVNGIDTTHLKDGSSDKEAIVDFLDEVQVVTSGFSAQHRVTTGSAISAITKSGTNQWRGMVGTYYDGSDFLAGRPRRELTVNAVDGLTPEYVTPSQDDSYTWEPVTEVGGPLRRDRLWIYTGYALRKRSNSRTVRFMENDQSGTFASSTREHNIYSSLTTRLFSSANVRLSSINERDRGGVELPSIVSDGRSLANPALFPSRTRTDRGSQLVSGSLDWIAPGRVTLSATTGVFTSGAGTKNAYTGYRRLFETPNLQFGDIPPALQHGRGYADAPSSFVTLQDDFSRWMLDASATTTARWLGEHSLTAGLQMERLANEYDSGEQSPVITLVWDRSTFVGEPGRGAYGYYTVRQFQSSGDVSTRSAGIFVQDRWRPTRQLTVDLGVRFERETIPSYRRENPGLKFGFWQKAAPRLGFAWDPTGSATWKVYGAWGAFFDSTKLELPRQFFGASQFLQSWLTLDTYDWTQISCASPAVSGPDCPGTLMATIDFRPAGNAPDAAGRPSVVDPALRPMRTHEVMVGVDRQLSRTVAAGVRYIRKRLDRAVEDSLVDPFVPASPFHEEAVYRITNPGYGLAEHPFGPDLPAMPRATRNYDALEFRVNRRLSGRWSLATSYTYSALRGNYAGLANSDEDGRNSPNIEGTFDELYSLFDASGRPVMGPLATDRPHVVKTQATYDFPWGTGVGVSLFVGSGTPLQRELFAGNLGSVVYYRGRSSDGRTPALTTVDLLVQHAFRLPHNRVVELEATALNVFDRTTPTSYRMSRFLDGFWYIVPDEVFFSGWDPEQVAAENGIMHNPAFGLADNFQERRSVRVAVRFRF
jgi:hypothetical protein